MASISSIPTSFALTVALALLTGILVATLAWRGGGRLREGSIPLGLFSSTVMLILGHGTSAASPDNVLGVLLVIGVFIGVWSGVMAWRAGGRWQEFSLAVAALVMALPPSLWDYERIGLDGILAGALIALAFWYPLIIFASCLCGLSSSAVRVRAGSWGFTLVGVPTFVCNVYLERWGYTALVLVVLVGTWGCDYMSRTGLWNRVAAQFDRWVKVNALRIVFVTGAFGIASPASAVLMFRHSHMRFVQSVMTRAHLVPAGSALALILAAWFGPMAIPRLPNKTRPWALGAALAFGCWVLAAGSLPADLASLGLIYSLVLMVVICGHAWLETPAP